ncbi:MAG: hypothetical protein GEU82_02215 [Luteitalea sp.]|nr:hypothetical protein [Luteitalea sp.]
MGPNRPALWTGRSAGARPIPTARPICLVLLLIIALGGMTKAATKSFVWKATSKQGKTIYLAGSVHLLSAQYYPLSPAFDTAFNESDLLVEEVDMGEMLAPESQLMMLTRGMLPAGQSLDKVISPATYAAVNEKVTALGMPMAPLNLFKPWALALTLQALEWQKAGFNADLGLDKHFYDMARTANKRSQGLETLEFQVSRFNDMPMDLQERLLAETLKELDTTQANFTRLADAWKAGDASGVEAIVLQDLKAEPEMYKRLLVERNRAWLPQVEALFARPKPAFVVVGAAHLIGADGLLQMLRARGYTIDQL